MIDRSQLPLITLSAVGHKPSHSVLPPEAGNASLSLVILFFKDGTNWLIRDTINSSSRFFPDVLPCFQTEHVEESGVDASPFKRKNAMGFLSPSGFAQHVLLHRKRRVLVHSSKSSWCFLSTSQTPRGLLSLAPTPVQGSAWRKPGRGYTHRWRQLVLANSSKRIQDFPYLGWTDRQIPSPTPPVPKPDALHCARYKESNRTGKAQNNPKQLLLPCWARSGKHLYSLVFSRLWVWLNEYVCTGFIAAYTCQKLCLVWGQKIFLI